MVTEHRLQNKAGRGGRNTEFLLGFALAADGLSGVWAIACDSDGIDGTEDAAGAIVNFIQSEHYIAHC